MSSSKTWQIWHATFPDNTAANSQQPLYQLKQAGLETVPWRTETAGGAGLLFFEEISQALLAFINQLSRQGNERVLAVSLSAEALSSDVVWQLLQSGASDVVIWTNEASLCIEGINARLARWREIDQWLLSPLVQKNLVGESGAWMRVLRQVIEVACFTQASVMITGESGTGKELIARLIHTLDQRAAKRNLIVLDCTTIVPELSGSEFFGHERGAFTGAQNPREGAFALADGGTLFLDEVGELPLPLQAELLRVIQEHSYKRVGSNQWRETDFRLVCATNRDLLQEEAKGTFRRDFYYRLASWTCHLPPLRERMEDILPLARHFLAQLSPSGEAPGLDDAVCEYLLQRSYPGNIRELRQVMTRIACRHTGPGPITVGDIPEAERPTKGFVAMCWDDQPFHQAIQRALLLKVGLKEIGRVAEETAERLALEQSEGNLQRAAQTLGITDRALQMRRAQRRQTGNGLHG